MMNGQQHFLRTPTKHACFLVDMILLLNIHLRGIGSQSQYGIESVGILIGVFLIVGPRPRKSCKTTKWQRGGHVRRPIANDALG